MYKRQDVGLVWLEIGVKSAAIALKSIHKRSLDVPEQDPFKKTFVQAIIRPKIIRISP